MINILDFQKLLDISKVIYIDTDTLVLDDVHKMWQLFSNFDTNHALGLVNNMADGLFVENGIVKRATRTGCTY